MDTYKTIKNNSEGLFKDRGSKFISLLFPVSNEDEIKSILQNLRKEYYDARHHCYAWRLGADLKRYRVNDDGEPSSTAGKPIYGQIQSFELTNILIVVIRYFGGTKLGVPGLINAYRSAAAEAITNNIILEKTVNNFYELRFNYELTNLVMRVIKDESANITENTYEDKCLLKINTQQSKSIILLEKLNKILNLEIKFITSY